jgi:transposase InsO family protein
MVRGRRPPSQTWRTFLANHVTQIMAADFFVVPTITYRLLFVLVILAHDRRRIVHLAVTAHPTAAWSAQQLREAFPEDHAPRYLLHDRDGAFAALGATADGMGIQEVCTAPRSPWQNAYVERVIGSIRRECTDHVVVMTEGGLRRILAGYLTYYTTHGRTWRSTRTRLSVGRSRQTDPSSRFRKSAGSTIDTSAAPRSHLHRTVSQSRGVWEALLNAFVGVTRGLRKVSVERCSQNISPLATSVLGVVSQRTRRRRGVKMARTGFW